MEGSVQSRAKHAMGKESSSATSNLKLHGETTNISITRFHKCTVYKQANSLFICAVKRLIASKITVLVYIIYVCVYIYYVCNINTHTCMYIFI